jgi:hypothetical protein
LSLQVPKAKVEVPSIEVVAQILEELDYKPLGDHKMMSFSGLNQEEWGSHEDIMGIYGQHLGLLWR